MEHLLLHLLPRMELLNLLYKTLRTGSCSMCSPKLTLDIIAYNLFYIFRSLLVSRMSPNNCGTCSILSNLCNFGVAQIQHLYLSYSNHHYVVNKVIQYLFHLWTRFKLTPKSLCMFNQFWNLCIRYYNKHLYHGILHLYCISNNGVVHFVLPCIKINCCQQL